MGLLPDGRLTCSDEMCDNASLRSALSAFGAINSGDVATFVLLDGWRRVHVTTLDADESLDVLRACGRIARVALGSVVDTIHLAADPPKTRDAVMGYRLGSEEPVSLSISSKGADVVAEMVLWARGLINRPPNLKSPQIVASEIAALASPNVKVKILGRQALVEASCGGILAVAAGSSHEPILLDLSYRPASRTADIALVGKGVVFDSGGLSVKSAAEMYRMKDDISGAAAVLGATLAIARLELPVAVRTLVPLVENMIGPAAMRPGDVIESAAGITIEIVSTDAEGRLILADALTLAARDEPDLIVDVASLTHAAETALGPNLAALFAEPDSVSDLVVEAGDAHGEEYWRLPLDRRLRERLKSDVADLKNADPGAPGGAISAAVFLEQFVSGRPWAHVDLGGTIWREQPEGHLSKGATAFGLLTLVSLARRLGGGSTPQQD